MDIVYLYYGRYAVSKEAAMESVRSDNPEVIVVEAYLSYPF